MPTLCTHVNSFCIACTLTRELACWFNCRHAWQATKGVQANVGYAISSQSISRKMFQSSRSAMCASLLQRESGKHVALAPAIVGNRPLAPTMRAVALTVTEPSCALPAVPSKHIRNRTIACAYRGPVAAQLHAGLRALLPPLPLPSVASISLKSTLHIRSMQAAARLGREGLGSPGGVLPLRPHRQPFTQRPPRYSCVAEAVDGSCGGNGACSGAVPPAASEGATLRVPRSACDVPCGTPLDNRSAAHWPQKSDIYILRSDGYSCTRETVQRELGALRRSGGGCLHRESPSLRVHQDVARACQHK